ncbi:esterase [Spirochaetia bacterium]|nr:esterase [Spirochaetia bacterium]
MKRKLLALFRIAFISIILFGCTSTNTIYEYSNPPSENEIEQIEPTIRYKLLASVIKNMDGKSIWGQDAEHMAEYFKNLDQSKRLIVPKKIRNGFNLTETKLNGRSCYFVEPKSNSRNDKVVLFLHGGGFVFDIDSYHWDVVKSIADKLSVPVFVPMYPVYPDNNPDVLMQFVIDSYTKLRMDFPFAEISVLGDSSGADLALSLCHYLSDNNIDFSFPDKIICVSPAMLFELDDDTIREMKKIEPEDIVFSMKMVESLPALFDLSVDSVKYFTTPLYGDFTKFPPIYVLSGTAEIFYPQIPPFVKRVKEQGKYIEFYSGYKLMHGWPYMPFAPECKKGLSIILEIISK